MLYEITLTAPGFDGTLTVLIESVRRHEINIIDVSLAAVARQVAYAVLESERMDFSPCTAVASLMFVKSRVLLPWRDKLEEPELDDIDIAPPEEEEEPTQVRERLLALYSVFQEAAENFRARTNQMQNRIRSGQTRTTHPAFLDEITFVDEITAYDLLLVMNQVLRRAAEEPRMYRVAADEAYVLNNRIAEVFSYIIERTGGQTKFSEIVARSMPKNEAVITFLAIVYLVSQGRIMARQILPYGEIIMSAREMEGSAAAQ